MAGPAPDPIFKAEKCYGVTAAGKNDGGSKGAHGRAGESAIAKEPNSWVFEPVGTCTKIEGGSTTPKSR